MNAKYNIVFEDKDIIAIEDVGHKEGRSVTNDALNVIASLAEKYGNLEDKRVIYRDSSGNWDGLDVYNNKFNGYYHVGGETLNDALISEREDIRITKMSKAEKMPHPLQDGRWEREKEIWNGGGPDTYLHDVIEGGSKVDLRTPDGAYHENMTYFPPDWDEGERYGAFHSQDNKVILHEDEIAEWRIGQNKELNNKMGATMEEKWNAVGSDTFLRGNMEQGCKINIKAHDGTIYENMTYIQSDMYDGEDYPPFFYDIEHKLFLYKEDIAEWQKVQDNGNIKKEANMAEENKAQDQEKGKTYVGIGWDNTLKNNKGQEYHVTNLSLKKEDLMKLPTDKFGQIHLTVNQHKEPDAKSKATHYVTLNEGKYEYDKKKEAAAGNDAQKKTAENTQHHDVGMSR